MDAKITSKEQQMYDRQIRVWGLEAQQKIRSSSILVIGINALSAEVCKNLVLAGVGRLSVLDQKQASKVSKEDISQIFFFSEMDINKPRDRVMVDYLRELNPNVKIDIQSTPINNIQLDLIQNFDVVCTLECPLIIQLYINRICREAGSFYFHGDVMGDSGFSFTDLGDSFVYSVKDVKKAINFVSLEQSIKSTLELLPKRKQKEKAFFLFIQSVYFFEYQHDRLPTINDLNALLQFVWSKCSVHTSSLASSHSVENDLIESTFKKMLDGFGENPTPTAAIVGGILAQEVLKSFSRNSMPLRNWMLYGAPVGEAAVVLSVE